MKESTTDARHAQSRVVRRTAVACLVAAATCALAAGALAARAVGMNPSSPVQRRDVEATDDTHLADIRLVTPDGASTTLAAELGTKPVLVNIWQADCAPCTAEMPLLGRIRGAMPDIDILGINSLEPLSKAHAAVRSTGIRYRWLRDPDGEFFVASDGVAVPRSLLVDLSGRVLDVRSGTFRSTQEIRRWIDGALRRTPGP